MKILQSIIIVFLTIQFSCLFPTPSHSCVPIEGYLQPSNYDLVKETDVILLAKAISFKEKTESDNFSKFKFKVVEVLKGSFKEKFFEEEGSDHYWGKGDEYDFSYNRPSCPGCCHPISYQIGKKYLLFLIKTKTGWCIGGPPYTRINEEVNASNSPWVTAVKHYIRISSLEDCEAEKIALKKLRENAQKDDKPMEYPIGLIKDIDNHFETPYPTKSYQDLIDLYNSTSSKYEREDVLWAFAWGKHPEAQPLIYTLIQSGEWQNNTAPVCKYIEQTKDHSTIKILASAFSNTRSWEDRASIINALIKISNDKDSKLMLSILNSSHFEEVVNLCNWFVKHPNEKATKIIKKKLDNQYQEDMDAAFCLAELGDQAVLEWAKKFIKSSDEDRWIGYCVIAHSPLMEAEKLVKSIIHGNDQEGLEWLIHEYGESFNPNKWSILREIIDFKEKNSEVENLLRITLEQMVSNGDTKAAELIKLMD